MSSDRTCRMSDLNALRNEFSYRVNQAEATANRAFYAANALQHDQQQLNQQMVGLHSEIGDLVWQQQRTGQQVNQLGQALAAQQSCLGRVSEAVYGLQTQQAIDRDRIQRNERLTEQIRRDITLQQGEIAATQGDVAEQRQMIDRLEHSLVALEQDTRLAHQRISENERHIRTLNQNVQQIQLRLDADAIERRRVREQQRGHVEIQARLADMEHETIDVEQVRQFGVVTQYNQAVKRLNIARQNQAHGEIDQAASALYQEAQLAFEGVRDEIAVREKAFYEVRSQLNAALAQIERQFNDTDQEGMREWYAQRFSALEHKRDDLRQRIQGGAYLRAGSHVQVLQAMKEMVVEADEGRAELEKLSGELTKTQRESARRVQQMTAVLSTLGDLWGQPDFDYADPVYVVASDPHSALKVQTRRGLDLPNVTVYADLDGTFRFSWTGYHGMECAKDADEMARLLREKQRIQSVVKQYQDRPNQANPPDAGDGGRHQPELMIPPDLSSRESLDTTTYQRR